MSQSFDVQGMTCQHCVKAVTDAITQLDPQAKVKVDLESGKVEVDSGQPRPALAGAIREAGYETTA